MSVASVTLAGPGAASCSNARPSAFVEFLLLGGVTLVLFPLAWIFRWSVGPDTSELTVDFLAFHAAFIINNPHFAATYLLFYKDAGTRALGRVFSRRSELAMSSPGSWFRSRSSPGRAARSRSAPRGRWAS